MHSTVMGRVAKNPYGRIFAPVCITATAFILVFLTFGGCSKRVEPPNRFYELLNLVPAQVTDTEYMIKIVDYASYREDNNISMTTADKQPITLKEYGRIVARDKVGGMLGGADITGLGRYAEIQPDTEKYLGINFTDVDAEIEAGLPPATMIAAIGRFDPPATRDALSHQDDWLPRVKEAYTSGEYRGVTVHSWGDGFKMNLTARFSPPHLDNLGRARPLAVTEEYLFYAPGVSVIQSMIDSSQDKAESLADVPEFASVANGLSDLNAYTAIIGDESLANGDTEYVDYYPGILLKKFAVFGLGLGRDGKGTYLALAIVHESPDDAEANITRLEQHIENDNSISSDMPWSEMITASEISVAGNVLLAKLYTDNTHLWLDLVYSQDTLLIHERE